jgi:hypothetical protein
MGLDRRALAFCRDVLGLMHSADWSTGSGRGPVRSRETTLELLDEAQAKFVDEIEAGRRVSGPVRLALKVDDSEETARRLLAGVRIASPRRRRRSGATATLTFEVPMGYIT